MSYSTVYHNRKYISARDIYTGIDLRNVNGGDIIVVNRISYKVLERHGSWLLVSNTYTGELCMIGNPVIFRSPVTRSSLFGNPNMLKLTGKIR